MPDHREEQDERWSKIIALACPRCGLSVLSVELPIALVWCASCPDSPLLERTAT
jgi:hypothetical protein